MNGSVMPVTLAVSIGFDNLVELMPWNIVVEKMAETPKSAVGKLRHSTYQVLNSHSPRLIIKYRHPVLVIMGSDCERIDDVEFGTCAMMPSDTPCNDGSLAAVKSRLSVSYVHILCSYLDLHCLEPQQQNDRGGWDLLLTPVRIRPGWVHKPEIHIQLKSTTSPKVHEGYISFTLDAPTFHKLRNITFGGSTLLCLLCLDEDTSKWVHVDAESLVLRKVMYWCKLDSYDDIPSEQDSVTLRISTSNVFDEATLHWMIETLGMGGEI